jgi:cation:H+ antiporter
MNPLSQLIAGHLSIAWIVLIVAFAILAKAADLFVTSSVSIAWRFNIPKLVIGLVLVSLATSAPELAVSFLASLKGSTSMAFGNAMGSVICNEGLGIGLAALLAATAIPVIPKALKTSGGFLAFSAFLLFVFVTPDNTLSRGEGFTLLILFAGYTTFLIRAQMRGEFQDGFAPDDVAPKANDWPMWKLVGLLAFSLILIVLCGDLIVQSASKIASAFGVSDAVIGLTVVALGTSIPEVATCVTAARKGHGELAVGTILGSDIINLCCVAGGAAAVRPLHISPHDWQFMFPVVFIIIATTLTFSRSYHRLSKKEGAALITLYAGYLLSLFILFRR